MLLLSNKKYNIQIHVVGGVGIGAGLSLPIYKSYFIVFTNIYKNVPQM